jgi:hypothetical protein
MADKSAKNTKAPDGFETEVNKGSKGSTSSVVSEGPVTPKALQDLAQGGGFAEPWVNKGSKV